MFSLTAIFFLSLYFLSLIGSIVYHPLFGVLGYMVTYNIYPSSQWWGIPFERAGFRFSLFIAVAIAAGMFFHREKLQFSKGLHSQEVLLVIFVALIWLSIPLGLPGSGTDNLALKITKVAMFLWMFSRIVTDLKKYELTLWTLVFVALYLGIQAYQAPTATFGRVDRGVGGADFSEGNFLAAHFAMLLPFIGVLFLKGGWKGRLVCLLSGVAVVNGIILCRSRGVFLALLLGALSSIVLAPSGLRRKVAFGVLIAAIGGSFLVDPGFWRRMHKIKPEISNVQIQDSSSRGRILAWRAALSMASDYPWGIGQDNFIRYVGRYNPAIPGKDTHNTYLRCLAELGIQGLGIYLLMIVNAFRILKRLKNKISGLAKETDYKWHIYALSVSLVIFLASGMFITHTYIEELYWLLMFPVVLERAVENEKDSTESVDLKLSGASV